jgi:hypothetical protein
MQEKIIAPKPATNSNRLLKSNLSSGKGWKKRINKDILKLMLEKSFNFLFNNRAS